MMEKMKIRLGTRGSPLAKAQSAAFAKRLQGLHPGLEIEFVFIKTSGDRFSAALNSGETPPPDGSGGAPNVKAMFVKEIETALLDERIDIAVHSSKDLPAELAPGMVIAAYPEREDPRDVFIGGGGWRRWQDLPEGSLIGTASLRRRIQLARLRPDFRFRDMRGNVETRLRKLDDGEAAGILLAKAGLKRLGIDDVPHQDIEPKDIVPAPGQGALAIEARGGDERVRGLLASIDHEATRTAVRMERELLVKLGGGCSTPLGAFAALDENGFSLRLFWSDPEGRTPVSLLGRARNRPSELSKLADGLYQKALGAQKAA